MSSGGEHYIPPKDTPPTPVCIWIEPICRLVYRVNDFIRTAHTVREFLGKEQRGPARRTYSAKYRGTLFMQPWIESYVKALPTEELARLKYLTSLREVSTHDLVVRPGQGRVSVEVLGRNDGPG